MLAMESRSTEGIPDDPLADVLTRTITTARPVFEVAPIAGIWTGAGCHLAGVKAGDRVDDETLEGVIRASGGGWDIVMTEPSEMAALGLASGRDRSWFSTLLSTAATVLPEILCEVWRDQGIGLQIEHAKLIGGLYAHPVSCCWPVTEDRYHVHCIVARTVGRD